MIGLKTGNPKKDAILMDIWLTILASDRADRGFIKNYIV